MFCRSAGNGKDNTRTGIGKFNEEDGSIYEGEDIIFLGQPNTDKFIEDDKRKYRYFND